MVQNKLPPLPNKQVYSDSDSDSEAVPRCGVAVFIGRPLAAGPAGRDGSGADGGRMCEYMTYNQHLRLKMFLYYAGSIILVIGCLGFLLVSMLALLSIYFQKMTELLALGIVLIGAGTTLVIISSHLGWHKSRIINFLLNQLSLIIITIGFIGIGTNINTRALDKTTLLFLLSIVLGFSFAGLGMKYRTHPQDT
jgi:hypothetical protein